jgi:hypothetical protein
MQHSRARVLVLLAAFAAAACAARAPQLPRVEVDPSAVPVLFHAPFGDLVEQWIDAPGSLFVRRPRPDLGAYHALRFEQPSIFYLRTVTPPLVSDHSALIRALGSAVRDQVSASIPLPETRERGAGILRVSSEVVDVEFDRSRATNSRVTSIIQPGATATFVFQLSDDATGTPLVRIAARRPMPGGIFTGPWTPDIDRATLLFRSFAKDARLSLAHVVRPVAAPE